MTTEIETHRGSSLILHDDQDFWSDRQIAALRQLGVDTNSKGDLAVFFHQAQATGLDPFKREIYMITRKGKPTIQTGIDGFYKIAARVTANTGGTWGIEETYWCGEDGVWHDVWLGRNEPAAAKVVVQRNGARFTTVALTGEYSAAGPMWSKMPARMIAKCAEALGIRKAFPEDLSGLYTTEEMAQADNPRHAPVKTVRRQTRATGSAPAPTLPPVVNDAPIEADEITGEIIEEAVDWFARMEPIVEDAAALRTLWKQAEAGGADKATLDSIAAAGQAAADAAKAAA
ncbi:hypothetical protein DWB68_10345 [Galactobacter valiniphilus]|uniref:Phage recombination protein Bet n=1 Tax=Galactobacter valiniphilus TaxID=2676122 RepID=A0A399JBK3_9MICC|nr:RecT family recombinase [Galactobacter valiniphilus]RII41917.1 hypothetical protein DWB68_10345 [Galactobacter valiniphilus]